MPEENKAVGRIWDMSSSLQSKKQNIYAHPYTIPFNSIILLPTWMHIKHLNVFFEKKTPNGEL